VPKGLLASKVEPLIFAVIANCGTSELLSEDEHEVTANDNAKKRIEIFFINIWF
jgi:hypothetical protein